MSKPRIFDLINTADNTIYQTINNTLNEAKYYTDEQVQNVSNSGVPKLVKFSFYAELPIGVSELEIPVDGFESSNDTLLLFMNTRVAYNGEFNIVDVPDERSKVVFNVSYQEVQHIEGLVLKNVAIGQNGALNGDSIAIQSMTGNRIKDGTLPISALDGNIPIIYTKLTDLGLVIGSETIISIVNAMTDGSIAILEITNTNNTAQYPASTGTLLIFRDTIQNTTLEFTGNSTQLKWYSRYIDTLNPKYTWKKIYTSGDTGATSGIFADRAERLAFRDRRVTNPTIGDFISTGMTGLSTSLYNGTDIGLTTGLFVVLTNISWNDASAGGYQIAIATTGSRVGEASLRYAQTNGVWSQWDTVYTKATLGEWYKGTTNPVGTERINYNGELWATRLTNATYGDLAEGFLLEDTKVQIEPGMLCCKSTNDGIALAPRESRAVVGVVSDTYGYLLNAEDIDSKAIIGLSGRVYVRLMAGETPEIGDLVVSYGGGYGMINNNPKIGTVVGKIMSNSPNEDGRYEMLIMLG
jgi:hypothetical protein